jgi:cellobiose phosphorylase
MQRGFPGLDVGGDALTLDPAVPGHLASLAVFLRFRGRPLDVAFSEGQPTLSVHCGVLNPLGVRH